MATPDGAVLDSGRRTGRDLPGRLAEAELRRAGDQLRRLDAAAEDAWADPGITPFAIAEGAAWKVGRAGKVLVAAGVLDQDYLHDLGADLGAAIKVRSRLLLNWDRRRGMLHRTIFEPPVPRPSRAARHAMRVTPVGRALRGASDRAPWTLHLMSLLRTETEAVITVAMRMHWPPDGSSADLELTGAGPITCRTTSSGRWTTRGLATRSGSRAGGTRRPSGWASPGCHPCPRPVPAGSTSSATAPA